MRTRVPLWVVILALPLIAAVGEPPPTLVSFPSDRTQIALSPDGKYSIVNVDNDSAEPHHTLYLEDRAANSRKKLLSYGRHVDILWNPDSSSFAVTDYVGSDFAECRVYFLRDKVPIDVATRIKDRDLANLRKNHHHYYVAQQWVSPTTLRVKMWGYGDANPSRFERFFIVDVAQGN